MVGLRHDDRRSRQASGESSNSSSTKVTVAPITLHTVVLAAS